MKLHLDRSAFQTLLLTQSERSSIRADILEKDYYVTLMLLELAKKQVLIPAFFKGGTALYKAISCIRRFSEDIDLTVRVDDCPSENQKQKRLEAVTKGYRCLPRNREAQGNIDKKGSITATYRYDSVVEVDVEDALQRFENVKVEATFFTISEPHEPIEISPLILVIATESEKKVLTESFEVNPFRIETIKLERIFIDKIFATEFYYLRKEYFDTAKHLYDIVVLIQNERIQRMLKDQKMLDYLIRLKREEEVDRRDSDLSKKEISKFTYLYTAMGNPDLLNEFSRMQKTYIYDDQYKIQTRELEVGISGLLQVFGD